MEVNAKYNVSDMTLRTGKELMPSEKPKGKRDHASTNGTKPDHSTVKEKEMETLPRPMMESIVIQPPFLSRMVGNKKEKIDNDILDAFRKVVINIPLLNMINQVLRYKKFLIEL